MTTTGDADADIDIGELVDAEDEEGFVDLFFFIRSSDLAIWIPTKTLARLFEASIGNEMRTLNLRISGWTSCSGLPFTLMRPLPCWRIQYIKSTSTPNAPCIRQNILPIRPQNSNIGVEESRTLQWATAVAIKKQ
jgi:hypothetical protein